MTKHLKSRLIGLLDELLVDGRGLCQTKWSPKGNWVSGPPVYVDLERFAEWDTRCQHFVELLGPEAQTWQTSIVDRPTNTLDAVVWKLGSLEGLRKTLIEGLLVRVEDLVRAESFSDLLEQAEYLGEQGYYVAAGVLGRAVLEEYLRTRCAHLDLPSTRERPTATDFATSLYKVKKIDKLTFKLLESMIAVGNAAAHNESSLTSAQVTKLLDDVREFLTNQSRHTDVEIASIGAPASMPQA